MEKNENPKSNVMMALSCKLDNDLNFKADSLNANYSTQNIGMVSGQSVQSLYRSWDWWERDYYPRIIKESYPVYIQERAQDKGKQAFEIIKLLKDKRFLKLDTVGDFIDCMDTLIKNL